MQHTINEAMTTEPPSPSGQSRIVPLPDPWAVARRAFANHWRDRKFVKAITKPGLITDTGAPGFSGFSGDYLVSGDRGVHAIVGGRFLRLTEVRTFGIAVRDGILWCAVSGDRHSSICRAAMPPRMEPGNALHFEEIHRARTSKNGRYHQIGFMDGRLAVAATENNAILFLDPMSGETLSECLPFRDRFGTPVGGDHNHINSVSQCGECLLFCAYKAGDRALLCVLHGDKLKAYPIANRGAHDVYLEGKNIWHSDTFGRPADKGGNGCGYPMKNNRPVDEAFFSAPPGKVMRGIAGTGAELLVGHSHKGTRAKRYDGNGSIIRLEGEKFAAETAVPFSQVYDILRFDGRHFDQPPAFSTWDEVNAHFASILGPCVYEFSGL